MTYLRLENLSKYYGDAAAVDGIDLAIEQGEFVSLLGPSGCGKTTTLQMIAGFVEPTAGRILLDGKDLTPVPPNRRGLGIVFQSYALFPHMTVAENVSFGLEMRRVSAGDRKKQVAAALDLVRLNAHAARYPRELSGGQRQRVALARALVIAPPLLLLDEPLSNLDAKLREQMQVELREIQRKTGTTTIMVTHDQAEALAISDRVALINGGRVVRADTPHAVYEDPQAAFAADFIGQTNLLPAQHGMDAARGAIGGAGRTFSLRPERIRLVETGQGMMQGHVTDRVFHGNHWRVCVATPTGAIHVLLPNDGRSVAQAGDAVGLAWDEAALRPVTEVS